MKVFVAGGTGAIGGHAVAALVAHGHAVTAMARTPEKAAALARQGAVPVGVSIFDPRSRRISSGLLARRSSPAKRISPPTIRPPGSGTRRRIDRQVMDFPEPDSPTIPSVSPRRTENVAPSTALTTPRRV